MMAFKTFGMTVLAGLALAGAAAAQTTVTPVNTNFTASGPTNLTSGGLSLMCTSTFKGKTSATGATASVTSATFSGFGCGLVSATGLPWTITAPNNSSIVISGVAVNVPFATCGPSNLTAAYTNPVGSGTSSMSFSNAPLAPNCSVSGTLTITPGLKLVP